MVASASFPSELSPSDCIMWRIERDPVLRSAILAVGLLDREPEWHAVRSTVAAAVARVPRFRQVVRSHGPGGRRLRWEDDPSFSLDYHLRRVRVGHPGDLQAVLDLAAPSATSMLDPARPQWELTLVDGLEGGRSAFILKFHHTITDGVGGVDLADDFFDVKRQGGRDDLEAVSTPPGPAGPGIADRVLGAARAGATAARQPARTIADAARFARSLTRMLEPVPSPLSPLFRRRGLDRRLDVIELPMDGLRAAAHAAGGTINDLFLAALAGGLHDFHERLGHELPAVRVTMPISLRREGDPPGGNRFTPARFVLPIDDPDPVRRTQIAQGIVRRWRDEPAVGGTEILARVLDELPTSVLTPLFGSMLKNVDLDAVDVPGMQHDVFLGGARVERMWAFAPPTGAALSVTLLSHADTACVGILADLAAVRDTNLLRACFETAFDEVLALGRQPQRIHAEVGA